MNSPIRNLDLAGQAPHSPRHRIAGFVIASRAVDKCRAGLAGTPGAYHFGCPLDTMLFRFKGITAVQFKRVVQDSNHYEDVGKWLLANGIIKTPEEIRAWSDEMEASNPMGSPEKRAFFIENCSRLGLDPQTNTTFDLLEADDRASFNREPASLHCVSFP